MSDATERWKRDRRLTDSVSVVAAGDALAAENERLREQVRILHAEAEVRAAEIIELRPEVEQLREENRYLRSGLIFNGSDPAKILKEKP